VGSNPLLGGDRLPERRMFAKTIIDSDAFLDMPTSTQSLYFHLAMRADDDGFINNPKKIQRMIGCSDDDLKLLIAKRFIIPFENGIVVIKHWKIHNYIQKDRYKPTIYQEEKKKLKVKDNGGYGLLDTECIQDVSSLETQVRLGKVRLELGKEKKDKTALEIAIDDFKDFRKKIKSPMTDRAVKLLLTELEKLTSDDEAKIAIINQSIMRGWKGVFPLKEEQQPQSSNPFA
jgi:hypothetical protein